MTDIVKKMKEAACPPNTGCMSVKMCVCDVMQDAADEIERLRAAEIELTILRSKLSGTLSTTTHDCTDRTECALREVVWHLRAIL